MDHVIDTEELPPKKKTKHKKQKKSEKIKLADAWKRNGEMKQWATTEKENERIRERKWKTRERGMAFKIATDHSILSTE